MLRIGFVFVGMLAIAPAFAAQKLDAQAINAATVEGAEANEAAIIRAQTLLDRAHFSPGVIDGVRGDNLDGAVAAFQRSAGLEATGRLDTATMDKLAAAQSAPATKEYEISKKDVGGPFIKHIPAKMEEQAQLDSLGYSGPREALAERFHMSEALLASLNPNADFDNPGQRILVADPDTPNQGEPAQVGKIIVNKSRLNVQAFDDKGALVAYYPASVGSEEKPAPSGETKITRVARNPNYTYNPDYAFKGVKTKEKFTIAPGPNNPVGAVWIELTGEGYGIHGTPDPTRIGKTESHGCVRLSNWDALDLAARVKPGVPVEFVE